MTTYQMTYQHDGKDAQTHTIRWVESVEDAAWIAKNYCDKFNCKLIDIQPNEA